MELRAASGQVNVAQLMSVRNSSGRISMPVSRAQSPYAQFKYVQGVPASTQNRAVPVNRLRVLNNLIESLVHLKDGSTVSHNTAGISDKAIDALIDQYAGQLHSALTKAPTGFSTGMGYTAGAVVNLTA